MYLLSVGMNHKTAPIDVRERLAIGDQTGETFARVNPLRSLREWVVLSTCNRTEIYAVSQRKTGGLKFIRRFLTDIGQIDEQTCSEALYTYADMDAVKHLFQVAAGLDSLVLGEDQILGQVRDAYFGAEDSGYTGPFLSQLFRQAIHVGKRIRTETAIGQGAASVSHAAVELARKIFGELDGKTVLLVGAGRMGELAAKNLKNHGVSSVLVANRTWAKADELASVIDGKAVPFENLPEWLEAADIVITSTFAPQCIISQETVKEVMRKRRGRHLFFIDIALPRDVEVGVHKVEGAVLYNVDDLQAVVEQNLTRRRDELSETERIIDVELDRFSQWWRGRMAAPVIRKLRTQAEEIRRSELEKAMRRLVDLDDQEKEQVKALSVAIVNKLLHQPTIRLKEAGDAQDADVYARAVLELFGLEENEFDGEAREGSAW